MLKGLTTTTTRGASFPPERSGGANCALSISFSADALILRCIAKGPDTAFFSFFGAFSDGTAE